MQKRDFETNQKRFRDFEILPKFSETHVFRGTIRHPLQLFKTISFFFQIEETCTFMNISSLKYHLGVI